MIHRQLMIITFPALDSCSIPLSLFLILSPTRKIALPINGQIKVILLIALYQHWKQQQCCNSICAHCVLSFSLCYAWLGQLIRLGDHRHHHNCGDDGGDGGGGDSPSPQFSGEGAEKRGGQQQQQQLNTTGAPPNKNRRK